MNSKASEIRKLQQSIAIDRNEADYKTLFILLYHSAIRFSVLITKNDEISEELYADAMMKIWFMGDKLMDIDSLNAYIFTTLRNSSLNYLKKEKKQEFVSLDDIDHDTLTSPSPENNVILDEVKAQIFQAVHQLPPKCLMVYQLIKEEGFSYKHTAEILNLSVNTIERHMQNALQKIAADLKSKGILN